MSARGERSVSEQTWRLSREISATRGDLDRYIGELRRRRHEMTDVRLQVRRHPGIVVGLGVVVVAAVVAAGLNARRDRKRRAVSRIRRALGALGGFATPSPPPLGRSGGRVVGLFVSAGVPIGVAFVKGLLRRSAAAAPRDPR